MTDQLRRILLAGGAVIALVMYLQTPTLPQPLSQESRTGFKSGAPRAQTWFVAFSDLAGHDAAESAINSMAAQGIMHGLTPTQFAPEMPLTRGDFVIAMQRMFNLPPSQSIAFSDVAPANPVYPALQAVGPYLGRQLLCFGCALGTNFMPSQAISKAEAIFTMTRVLAALNKLQLLSPSDADSVLAGIPDLSELSPPSRVYFATAIRNGISPLGPENRILPASEVTRADAAVLLDRVQRKFDIPRLPPSPD